MVVKANLSNGEAVEIKNYTVTPELITYPMDSVTVSFAGHSATLNITVEKDMRNVTVAEVFTLDNGAKAVVEGVYVGVSDTYPKKEATNEILIKDEKSDNNIVSVKKIEIIFFIFSLL